MWHSIVFLWKTLWEGRLSTTWWMNEGYSYSKEILIQSMEREFSSSSFRWLCRETCRCIVAMSVTYFILKGNEAIQNTHYEWLNYSTVPLFISKGNNGCFWECFKKKTFLLCDFIMNPLVCQPNDSPPANEGHSKVCTEHCAFPPCLSLKRHFYQSVYQSMSLVSLVNTHASSKNIMAAWQDTQTHD